MTLTTVSYLELNSGMIVLFGNLMVGKGKLLQLVEANYVSEH